jgi:hypothetical protein
MEWQMARKSYVFCGKTFELKYQREYHRELLKYRKLIRKYTRGWMKDHANRERKREYMREYKREWMREKRNLDMFCGILLAAQVLPKVFKEMGIK